MDAHPGSKVLMKKSEEQMDGKLRVYVRRSSVSSRDSLIQNRSNFKRSSEPSRFMFYENRSWVDYPKEVMEVMRLGFAEGKAVIEAQIKGRDRVFDFYRMLDIELETGNQRSMSWIDVDGKCFFPKVFVNSYDNDDRDFVNCDDECPKIEIEIKISENSRNSVGLKGLGSYRIGKLSKRKREDNIEREETGESSPNFDSERRQLVSGDESRLPKWPKTRVLNPEEKGYAVVRNLFLSGLEMGAEVTAIHQCARMGPLDKGRCQVFAKQMEVTKHARGESNMVFAWYGTSAEGAENVLTHGFGLPMSRSEGHGMGIHLSPIRSSHNSAILSETDENGNKHVLLCRVILGNCEKVESGSNQCHPSSVQYDSGVDDLANPKWYTVWHTNMNTHILPECVVTYKPGNGVSNGNCVPHPSIFIAKLIDKLKSCLPLNKIQELKTLWGSYREGRFEKDIFLQQLRSVVGDNVLRAIIREIRG